MALWWRESCGSSSYNCAVAAANMGGNEPGTHELGEQMQGEQCTAARQEEAGKEELCLRIDEKQWRRARELARLRADGRDDDALTQRAT